MSTAYCLIRRMPCYRRQSFVEGLSVLGYQVREQPPRGAGYAPGDLLVIWNRYGRFHDYANQAESQGALVIVAENGYLGREWRGGYWYALSAHHHNGAGQWYPGGPERWDSFGIDLEPWRDLPSGEFVLLPQRGIGPPMIKMPTNWAWQTQATMTKMGQSGRIREHPGEKTGIPLLDDLAEARAVVTWGSGAALKALIHGIPCYYGFGAWIGQLAGTYMDHDQDNWPNCCRPRPRTNGRAEMFRRLAWAMWSTDELATGEPFKRLIEGAAGQ